MRITLALLTIAGVLTTGAFAADKDAKAVDRLDASADLVGDLFKAADKGIPQELIEKAQCVVAIPGMKKGGFVVGVKYGRGFASCRRAGGMGWSAPAAMRMEGGSFGFQIGASEQDVLLLVMSQSGMKHLLQDKFTVGGDATAAAGPLGRDASAQTDAMMHAEILSYSRSRGLFAGLVVEGSTLRPDQDTNAEIYGKPTTNREILASPMKAPAVASKFEMALNRNSMRK